MDNGDNCMCPQCKTGHYVEDPAHYYLLCNSCGDSSPEDWVDKLIYLKPPPPCPLIWTVVDPGWNKCPGPWTSEDLEKQAWEFATGIKLVLTEGHNWMVTDNDDRIIAVPW